ncbi:cell division cycle 5-like protein, variant [Capsaspora owczarzaki ATCC 30864]|uniref:Cell division cycle 5-like protein, variant n=1 Tax=Capsaspora owczarzaki (strain ATCC 30864) TaxID=595528 RepID=A0A0D2WJK2_CAPO3|nr:cell division cycle 5-like protein, variant [Capsaspora owczarzaki ATCC 30864]
MMHCPRTQTEWSREEEEKLLHLAKLMPTQWRTIAPMIGRTAAQCLEHYERLLDQAQARETGEDVSTSEARKLRPGEIDPHPETKPARPDPVDMDEDEKEMLSEARARLANTQGKKSKRKARERQLEEARRLASLQKRRELAAAGIEMPRRFKKRGQIDLNAEVPLHKVAPRGFYDTSMEVDDGTAAREFKTRSLQDLEGKKSAQAEAEMRKKDKEKLDKKKSTDLVGLLQADKELERTSKRARLELPAPQVSEAELEEIVKLGYSTEKARAAVLASRSTASSSLLSSDGADGSTGGGSILQSAAAVAMRAASNAASNPNLTARTPMSQDIILEEAQNLLALTRMETPLKGGDGPEVQSVFGFDGMTPRRQVTQTPNVTLRTPLRTPAAGGMAGGMTPRVGDGGASSSLGGSTPFRDSLRINDTMDTDDLAAYERDQRAQRSQLLAGLAALPKPKNDFEIVLPELEGSVEDVEDEDRPSYVTGEEDREEIEARNFANQRAEELAAARRRSQAVQRHLPRPSQVNPAIGKASGAAGVTGGESTIATSTTTTTVRAGGGAAAGGLTISPALMAADDLIKAETAALLRIDTREHPAGRGLTELAAAYIQDEDDDDAVASSAALEPAFLASSSSAGAYGDFSDDEIVAARKMLAQETEIVRHVISSRWGTAHEENGVSMAEYERVWLEALDDVTYVPSQQRYGRTALASKKDRTDALAQTLGHLSDQYQANRKQTDRAEKKLIVLTTGFQTRVKNLKQQIGDLTTRLEQSEREQACFAGLRDNEQSALPARLQSLVAEVDHVSQREKELQSLFSTLSYELTSKATI